MDRHPQAPREPHTFLSHLEREVFDGSRLGVIERGLDNSVRYANRAALDMFGVPSVAELQLGAIFAGRDAAQVLDEQTEQRRHGRLGNYSVTLTRLDNP